MAVSGHLVAKTADMSSKVIENAQNNVIETSKDISESNEIEVEIE